MDSKQDPIDPTTTKLLQLQYWGVKLSPARGTIPDRGPIQNRSFSAGRTGGGQKTLHGNLPHLTSRLVCVSKKKREKKDKFTLLLKNNCPVK